MDLKTSFIHNNNLYNLNQNKMSKIPFDLEKWQSGNYDVEYRGGSKPLAVYYIKESENWPIITVTTDKKTMVHLINGCFYLGNNPYSSDLFLTKKKKKGWVVVYRYGLGSSLYSAFYKSEVEKKEHMKQHIEDGYEVAFESEFEY